ncbi:MAG: hypothetical protein HYW86_05150 [Candidatus Roizmanbacteria bacterium]|nr:MAG: hypothetical protein HYW86_05150 [Candidatus Roizmanbacteria bacterium]
MKPTEGQGLPLPAPDIKPGVPSTEKKRQLYLNLIDKKDEPAVTAQEFKAKFSKDFKAAGEIITNVQSLIPKNSGESQSAYELRVMKEVEDRLRHGEKYIGKNDKIFDFVTTNIDANRDPFVLMGVEAHKIIGTQVENDRIRKEEEASELGQVFRRDVKKQVAHVGQPSYVEGPYDHYFDENGHPSEMPQGDLYSMTLVADRLLDIADPATQKAGETQTYRDQMKKLEETMNSDKSSKVEKNQAGRALVSLRSHFYTMMIEAIRTLDQPKYVNPDPSTQSAKDQVLTQMYGKLNEVRETLRQKGVGGLVEQYKGVQTTGFREGWSDKRIDKEIKDRKAKGEIKTDEEEKNLRKKLKTVRLEEMKNLLKDKELNILDFALKGADLMQRRISYTSESQSQGGGSQEKIYFKARRQGPSSLEEVIEDDDEKKKKKKTEQDDEDEDEKKKKKKTEQDDEDDDEKKKKKKTEQDDEDEKKKKEKGPEDINPAPGDGDGEKPNPEPKPIPPAPIKPGEGLKTEMNLALVALQNQSTYTALRGGKHYMAEDIRRIGVPPNRPLVGGILWGLRHPIKAIWQNSILRTVFEMQHTRFSADFDSILKDKMGSRAIPVDVSNDIMDKALVEGRSMRGRQGFLQRGLWKAWDSTLNGLFGIGQNSEQVFAKKWLRSINKDQWKDQIGLDTKGILKEQTELGRRYANLSGLTLTEANRILDPRTESRYQLPSEASIEVNRRIKDMIARYSAGTLTDEQLVAEVDNYFLSADFRNLVPANLRNEINAPGAGGNILDIAEAVKNNWNQYQTEKGESGKTKWEELKLNILYGRGEFGNVRGGVESGFLVERLARRLVNRENRWYDGRGGFAGALAAVKDIGTYGGAYALGWVASGAMFGTSTLVRSAGGVVGVSFMAGFKESGFRVGKFGVGGRLTRELSQLSKEMAEGRITPNDARIRLELSRALVGMKSAEELLQGLEGDNGLLKKQQLSQEEQQQLFARVAEIRARMRLTQLSNTRELGYMTQNFVGFEEGKLVEQQRRLESAVLNGRSKLSQTLLAGDTWGDIQYRPRAQQRLGVFDRSVAVIEAQLRMGNDEKNIRGWLRNGLNMSEADINSVMTDLPKFRITVDDGRSLREASRISNRLHWRGFGKTVAKTAIMGGGASLAAVPVIAEGQHLLQEGFQQYTKNWGDVLGGHVPIRNLGGHAVSDLTPLQKGVLEVRGFVEVPHWPIDELPLHRETIDGVDINLGAGVRHEQLPGGGDYLVDTKTGNVYDLTDYHFTKVDNNGVPNIALVNEKTGATIGLNDPASPLKDFASSPGTPVTETREEVILADNNKLVDSDITLASGKTIHTQIPEGTAWTKDTQGNWDLIVANGPGKGKILIDNTHFDAAGKITGADSMNAALKIDLSKTGGGEVINGPAAAAEWEKMGTKIDHREWYSYDQPESQGNELRLYTFKEGDTLILDMSKMGTATQTGLNPNPIDVGQVIKDGQAGMAISVPGLASKPFWIPDGADGVIDGKVTIDLNDHTHMVALPNGQSVSMSEIGNMLINKKAFSSLSDGNIATELNSRQDVFNIGADGKMGFIEAGRLVANGGQIHNPDGSITTWDGYPTLQAFATIRGAGGVSIEGPGGFSIIDLNDSIKDNVTVTTPIVNLRPPIFGLDQLNFDDMFFVPFPARQNIERSVGVGEVPPETSTPSDQTGRPGQTGKPNPPKPGPSDQEKKMKDLQEAAEKLRKKPNRTKEEEKKLEEIENELQELESSLKEKKEEKPEIKSSEELQLQAIFERITGPVNKENGYYIENVPDRFNLAGEQIKALESKQPFFIVEKKTEEGQEKLEWKTNDKVVPWAWDLTDTPERGKNDQRFINGEAVTKNDSGLLAVSAASAETAAKQALLYKHLADVVLQVHKNNPALLGEWLKAQGDDVPEMEPSSLLLFKINDVESFKNHEANNVLLSYNSLEPGKQVLTVNNEGLKTMWSERIKSLQESLNAGKLTGYQIRWIEFLSHSVDVAGLLKTLREQKAPLPQTKPSENETEEAQSVIEDNPGDLKEVIRDRYDQFEEKARNGEIQENLFSTGVDNKFKWQRIVYGSPIKSDSDHAFRGYLMIEPEDFPGVLDLLMKVGEERKKRHDRLDFKWLMGAYKVGETNKELGKYDGLLPTDARVAIYGDSQVEIEEILKRLADDPRWQEFENNRIKKSGGKPENAPRRPGTNALKYKLNEFRSLNYNNKPGYSEHEAADPNWRDNKVGDKTVPA